MVVEDSMEEASWAMAVFMAEDFTAEEGLGGFRHGLGSFHRSRGFGGFHGLGGRV